jgi:hypothetical protein
MSDAERHAAAPETDLKPAHPSHAPLAEFKTEESPTQGPSLALLWGLIALALAAAIGFALLIVLPFYRRR